MLIKFSFKWFFWCSLIISLVLFFIIKYNNLIKIEKKLIYFENMIYINMIFLIYIIFLFLFNYNYYFDWIINTMVNILIIYNFEIIFQFILSLFKFINKKISIFLENFFNILIGLSIIITLFLKYYYDNIKDLIFLFFTINYLIIFIVFLLWFLKIIIKLKKIKNKFDIINNLITFRFYLFFIIVILFLFIEIINSLFLKKNEINHYYIYYLNKLLIIYNTFNFYYCQNQTDNYDNNFYKIEMRQSLIN